MNKKVSFSRLLKDKNFWTFFFTTNFPLAYDKTLDLDLISFVDENYEEISTKIYKWSMEFTQYYDGVINECDGYIDNPTYIKINLNDTTLKIEYHPGGTLYILNDVEIANLDGEYQIKKIDYNKFDNLTSSLNDDIKILLLPILYMDKCNQGIEILINKILKKTYFNPKDFNAISKLVMSHITNN